LPKPNTHFNLSVWQLSKGRECVFYIVFTVVCTFIHFEKTLKCPRIHRTLILHIFHLAPHSNHLEIIFLKKLRLLLNSVCYIMMARRKATTTAAFERCVRHCVVLIIKMDQTIFRLVVETGITSTSH
jgi:hypothetical protein